MLLDIYEYLWWDQIINYDEYDIPGITDCIAAEICAFLRSLLKKIYKRMKIGTF